MTSLRGSVAATPATGFRLTSADGMQVACARWDSRGPVLGVVQIAHGMGEHKGRYADTIEVLRSAGLTVYANDHRGHGRTVTAASQFGDFGAGGFDLLVDITAVDYLEYPGAVNRFGVVYLLLSTSANIRLIVKTFVNPPEPSLPTATDLWRGADWMEREVYDMYGIRFLNHPDLRRILTWKDYPAHPLRKDYPLRGRGEREMYRVLEKNQAD